MNVENVFLMAFVSYPVITSTKGRGYVVGHVLLFVYLHKFA